MKNPNWGVPLNYYLKDGYWHIAGTNTGVPATGPRGPRGEKGDPGDPNNDILGLKGQVKDFNFIRNTKVGIDNTPIVNGQVLMTTDQTNNMLYLDVGTTRKPLNSVARVDELEERIDNFGYINVKDFGAKGDGVQNDTTFINDCILQCVSSGENLLIPNGTYIVDGITIPDYINVFCYGTLKASSVCTSVVTINVPYFADATFSKWKEYCTMRFVIDCNETSQYGINAIQGNHVTLRDTMIYNSTGTAIKQNDICPEMVLDNIFIEGKGIDSVGIYVGSDTEIRNIVMKDCHTGFYLTKKTDISHVHAWITENYLDSILFKHITGTAILSDIYADTYQYPFYKADNTGYLNINNVFVYNNTNFTDGLTGYVFKCGVSDSFAYCNISGIKASSVTLAKLDSGTTYRIPYINCYFSDNVILPPRNNLIYNFTITGQTGGTNYISRNVSRGEFLLVINCVGTFAYDAITTTSPFPPSSEFKAFQIACNTAAEDVYKPNNMCNVLIEPDGKLKFRPFTSGSVRALYGIVKLNEQILS